MFRGCHRWVYSLVCAFCILSMLFLDTLSVSANSVSSASDLNGPLVASDRWVTNNFITVNLEPTSSGGGLTSATVDFSTSDSGSLGRESGSYTLSGTVGSSSLNLSGSQSSTTGYLSLSGSEGSSGLAGSGTTSSNGRDYSSSGSVTGNISFSGSSDNSCNLHFRLPYKFLFRKSDDSSIFLDKYYAIFLRPTISHTTIPNNCSITNVSAFDNHNNLVGSYDSQTGISTFSYYTGAELLTNNSDYIGFLGFLEFDLFIDSFTTTQQLSLMPVYYDNVYIVKDDFQSVVAGSNSTSDSITHNELNELNSTQKDTNTKVTNFFDSFFDNLLHIFVPEDGYFSQWFNRVNSLLSDKLGMLYAPFDLVITTLQAIYSADNTETGIPFPGIQWEDTWLIEPFTFTFTSLGNAFDDLRDKVYFATDTVLVLTFLMLLQSKVKLILEGHE